MAVAMDKRLVEKIIPKIKIDFMYRDFSSGVKKTEWEFFKRLNPYSMRLLALNFQAASDDDWNRMNEEQKEQLKSVSHFMPTYEDPGAVDFSFSNGQIGVIAALRKVGLKISDNALLAEFLDEWRKEIRETEQFAQEALAAVELRGDEVEFREGWVASRTINKKDRRSLRFPDKRYFPNEKIWVKKVLTGQFE